MKKSLVACMSAASFRNTPDTRSQNSFGESPSAAALRATFEPCSSVPVRKKTSSPRCRWWRATTSAASVVYAWPRWGFALT